ncbi:DUF433 domain-containing protein [Massilia sp. Root351]|jgi:uncharacterized protein (DUF433 family)|uniref:DUF433 domain-containing protein n=1 Tax=Massilia sp. Root351 TaxID=1736522 RepID=UPI0009E8BD89|nr:DUF433 domain-containing protein [Massilia sp. Root351]
MHATAIQGDPQIQGVPIFVGTRVPVRNMFDCLAAGDPLEEVLDQFPSVSRSAAVATWLAQTVLNAYALVRDGRLSVP